jgi:hypothetical protein
MFRSDGKDDQQKYLPEQLNTILKNIISLKIDK